MAPAEEILEELGFSKNEAKVYLALLDIGCAPAGKISEKSGVHRTNVYDALGRLREKGLISFITKGEINFYEATDPKNLMDVLKEKETHLKTVLPQLLLSQTMVKSKGEAHIYEGIRAVRDLLNHFLDIRKPRYVYGVPNIASELLGKGFLEDYHKRRIKLKLPMQHIYNSDAKERISWLNSLPLTESKYLPSEYNSPVATSICGDEIVLTLYSKNPLSIQIKNAEIASAYKKYFDLLWTLAKKE